MTYLSLANTVSRGLMWHSVTHLIDREHADFNCQRGLVRPAAPPTINICRMEIKRGQEVCAFFRISTLFTVMPKLIVILPVSFGTSTGIQTS